ncbi:MAG TPA: SMP-30/gluconolactonase/LRE family protein [Oscillatoriaceae cyanobacterium]
MNSVRFFASLRFLVAVACFGRTGSAFAASWVTYDPRSAAPLTPKFIRTKVQLSPPTHHLIQNVWLTRANLWITRQDTDTVEKYALDGALIKRFDVRGDVAAIAAADDGSFCIADDDSGRLDFYSATGTLQHAVVVGTQPSSIVRDSQGNLWVSCYGDLDGNGADARIMELSSSGEVLHTLPLSVRPDAICVSPQGAIDVLANTTRSICTVSRDGKVLRTFQMSEQARAFFVDARHHVWVAPFASDAIKELDADGRVLDVYEAGFEPVSFFGTRAGTIYVAASWKNAVFYFKPAR